jgi:hypothetical protein
MTDVFLRQLAAILGRRHRPLPVPRFPCAGARLGDLAWTPTLPTLDSSRLAELDSPGFVCSVECARGARVHGAIR